MFTRFYFRIKNLSNLKYFMAFKLKDDYKYILFGFFKFTFVLNDPANLLSQATPQAIELLKSRTVSTEKSSVIDRRRRRHRRFQRGCAPRPVSTRARSGATENRSVRYRPSERSGPRRAASVTNARSLRTTSTCANRSAATTRTEFFFFQVNYTN